MPRTKEMIFQLMETWATFTLNKSEIELFFPERKRVKEIDQLMIFKFVIGKSLKIAATGVKKIRRKTLNENDIIDCINTTAMTFFFITNKDFSGHQPQLENRCAFIGSQILPGNEIEISISPVLIEENAEGHPHDSIIYEYEVEERFNSSTRITFAKGKIEFTTQNQVF